MEFEIGDHIRVSGLIGLFPVCGWNGDGQIVFFIDETTGDELSTDFDQVENTYRDITGNPK